MVRVILGDTFRRIVKRGDTIWPHSGPKPPPEPEPEEEEPPAEPQPEPVE